ncbi:MAG: AI-2E family transporter [Saprospiraceae bacterium]|nr:AI-2E family transporter [Saprospiraceae bacterium]
MRDRFYWLATTIIVLYVLYIGKVVIFPLILSTILAVMFNRPIRWLQKALRWHAVAFLVFCLILVSIMGFGFYLFGEEVSNLFSEIDSANYSWKKFETRLEQIFKSVGIWDGEWQNTLANQLNEIASDLSSFLGSMISSGTNFVIGVILTVVFTFFISMYYESVKGLLNAELEKPERKMLRIVTDELPNMIRNYFKGLGIVMIILAVANSLLFWIAGLDYPWVWGVLVGALTIIPYIGTTIALLLPLSYSFLTAPSFTQPIVILLGFAVIQQIEGNLLTPKIVGEHVNLNAFTALICTIIGGLFWGIAGAVIAIPTAGALRLVLTRWEGMEVIAKLMGEEVHDYGDDRD